MTHLDRWPLIRWILIVTAILAAVAALTLVLLPDRGRMRVLVLAVDVSRGQELGPAAVRAIDVPEEARPRDALPVDAPLPKRWPGEPAKAGTVLSESTLAGSALGRALEPGKSVVSIVLDGAQVPPLEPGDSADLWGFPENCDVNGCSAILLSSQARISSISVSDGPAWETSPAARIDLIVDAADTEEVLGHAGTGTLSLAMTSSRID